MRNRMSYDTNIWQKTARGTGNFEETHSNMHQIAYLILHNNNTPSLDDLVLEAHTRLRNFHVTSPFSSCTANNIFIFIPVIHSGSC